MTKNFIFICALLLGSLISLSQVDRGYVKNIKGDVVVGGKLEFPTKSRYSIIFLYEIKGNDEYVLDSAKITSHQFSFKNRSFQAGVYRLSFQNPSNHETIDIVVNPKESQNLVIDITHNVMKRGYNVNGSVENKMKKLYTIKEESISQKLKLIRKSQKTRDQKISEMKILQNELFDYGLSLNNQYPGTYFGMILSHMQSKNINSSHLYFDDMDFTDESIIRSPLLPNRIQIYFQTHANWPNNQYGFHDAIDYVMDNAKANDNVAEFCMYNMLDGFYNTGQTDKKGAAIWMDLCNYIMDEYIFGEGCGDDVEPSELLKNRASQFKNLQLGNIPPNFSVLDINRNNINLQNICKSNKFTVLMFWASHCTHCMAELPGFASWYNKKQNSDFEIIAVSLDRSEKTWKQTVQDNNFNWRNVCQVKDNKGLVYKSPICLDYKIKKTPTMFVFNENMQIVAKPKSTHQLRSFLLSNK